MAYIVDQITGIRINIVDAYIISDEDLKKYGATPDLFVACSNYVRQSVAIDYGLRLDRVFVYWANKTKKFENDSHEESKQPNRWEIYPGILP